MAPKETKDFTERELQILATAWLCFSEQPKPDFHKLARLNGFTNVGSASNAWATIKKKLQYQAGKAEKGVDDGEPAQSFSEPAPKATPRKRGKKANAENDETPTKKAKGQNGKAIRTKPAADKSDDGNDDGDSAEEDEEDKAIIKEEQLEEDFLNDEDGV